MQNKAVSLIKLNDLQVVKDAGNAKLIVDKSTDDGQNQEHKKSIQKRRYNFLINNCSEDVAKIAEAGGLTVKNELVPKAMIIVTVELYKLFTDELLW